MAKQTNIGYHSLIPQNLEARLEALEAGAGGGDKIKSIIPIYIDTTISVEQGSTTNFEASIVEDDYANTIITLDPDSGEPAPVILDEDSQYIVAPWSIVSGTGVSPSQILLSMSTIPSAGSDLYTVGTIYAASALSNKRLVVTAYLLEMEA